MVATKSGTIVVIGASKNKIVVAADSRAENDAGEYDDHECKIIALSDKFVFAFNGIGDLSLVLSTTDSSERYTMNAGEEAKLAFESVPPGSDDFLSTVALLWGRHVSRIFRQAIAVSGTEQEVFADIKEGGAITQGYFLGLTPKGGLVLYMENVIRLGNDVSFTPVPEAVPLTDAISYTPHGGFIDTVEALRRGKTEWAKKEIARWERLSFSLAEDDRDVLKAVRWVQLTLDAHQGSHRIGGPIDSLTLDPITGIRWHSVKKECGDQQH